MGLLWHWLTNGSGVCFYVSSIIQTFAYTGKMSAKDVFNGYPGNRYFTVSENEMGKAVVYNIKGGIYTKKGLPKKYQTDHIDEIRYLVYADKGETGVGSYTNGAKAVRIDYVLSIVDLKDWTTIAKETFHGGSPPSTTSSGGKKKGSAPKMSEVKEWIESEISAYEAGVPKKANPAPAQAGK